MLIWLIGGFMHLKLFVLQVALFCVDFLRIFNRVGY